MGLFDDISGMFHNETRPEDVQPFVQSPGLQSNQFTDAFNNQAAGLNNQSTALQQQGQASQQFGQNVYNQGQQLAGYANNGAQANAANQQQAFVNALQAQAAGQGPSVSQTVLGQAMDRNAANANAQAASMRGVNAGLALRQAQQGTAAANQNAAAQAVVGRQQEQMNAQNQLGGALSGMRAQDIQNAQGYNQAALGYGQLGLGYGNQGLGYQNSALEANRVAQGYQGMGLNAAQSNLSSQMGASQINSGIATGNTTNRNQLTGHVLGSIMPAWNGMSGGGGGGGAGAAGPAEEVAWTGGKIGGKVKGGRINAEGDDPANDTVHAMLSPGEIVIPRTKAKDPDQAKEFIDHLMKNKKGSSSTGEGYGKVLEAHRNLKAQMDRIEQMLGKAK